MVQPIHKRTLARHDMERGTVQSAWTRIVRGRRSAVVTARTTSRAGAGHVVPLPPLPRRQRRHARQLPERPRLPGVLLHAVRFETTCPPKRIYVPDCGRSPLTRLRRPLGVFASGIPDRVGRDGSRSRGSSPDQDPTGRDSPRFCAIAFRNRSPAESHRREVQPP